MNDLTPEQVAKLVPYRIVRISEDGLAHSTAYISPPPILWPGDTVYVLYREDR